MDLTAWKPAFDKVRPTLEDEEDAKALETWWTELAGKADQFESPKLLGTHQRELTIYGGYECSLCHARLFETEYDRPRIEMIPHEHVLEIEEGGRFNANPWTCGRVTWFTASFIVSCLVVAAMFFNLWAHGRSYGFDLIGLPFWLFYFRGSPIFVWFNERFGKAYRCFDCHPPDAPVDAWVSRYVMGFRRWHSRVTCC
jgi:hypothetical protein